MSMTNGTRARVGPRNWRWLAYAVVAANGERVVLPIPDDMHRDRVRTNVMNAAWRAYGEKITTHWDGKELTAWLYIGP